MDNELVHSLLHSWWEKRWERWPVVLSTYVDDVAIQVYHRGTWWKVSKNSPQVCLFWKISQWSYPSRVHLALHFSYLRSVHTVFLWSDAVTAMYFTACFVWLLFEGGVYFFGKPGDINDSWIRYVRVRRWQLLDAVSSTRSLSVLLLAVAMTRTTQTVLALAWWLLSEIICICVCVPCLLATATIRGQRLFCSRASGCAATIRGRCLFKEIRYICKSTLPFTMGHYGSLYSHIS